VVHVLDGVGVVLVVFEAWLLAIVVVVLLLLEFVGVLCVCFPVSDFQFSTSTVCLHFGFSNFMVSSILKPS
jgi:hypothetical protein